MRIQWVLVAALAALPLDAQTPLVERGRAALTRNDVDAAVDLLEKAVAQTPKIAQAHYWLGSAYGLKAQRSGMFGAAMLAPKARTELEQAVALDPNYVEARFALAEFYAIAPGFMGGDEEKALAQAAEIRKRDALAGHRAFAVIYATQKKPELAKKEYVDAVREQPASPKAHTYLAQYLAYTEKNYPAAFEELETAVRLDAGYMPALFHIGRTAAASGTNLPRGTQTLEKYLAYTPKDNEPPPANAHYWLGIIYEKQGRKSDAKQQYKAALELNPSLKSAADALKRVS